MFLFLCNSFEKTTEKRRVVSLLHNLCLFAVCIILIPATLVGQNLFHISLMANYECTDGYWPGYDVTLLFSDFGGIRYTSIPDVSLFEAVDEDDDNVTIAHIEMRDKLEIPMLFKTLDFRSFGHETKTFFDFITAYYAIGYNESELSVSGRSYSSSSDRLSTKPLNETVKTNLKAAAFGIYGGERFVFIDARVMYIMGHAEEGEQIRHAHDFDKWMIFFAVGVGF